MQVKIKNSEIQELLIERHAEFPKYTSQIINRANFVTKGTAPNVVGQMSDLIQEFPGQSFDEWVDWYKERHPNAIDNATDKIVRMLDQFRNVMPEIDRRMVKEWVEDLVLAKTFTGLKFQEAIFKYLSNQTGVDYRMARPDEESQGIDGFLGGTPISIKPKTYGQLMRALPEQIDATIIYYEKKTDGIVIEVPTTLVPFHRNE